MIKTVEQLTSLKGKKVLVRVDFNVPFKDGVIKDDNRIIEALPTLKYLLSQGAKVIIFSHLGKVNHKDPLELEKDKAKNDMAIVYNRVKELIPCKYVAATQGQAVVDAIASLKNGEALLLQNTRYEKGEEKNDPKLAEFYASLVDAFVMDAFGSAHRAHASTYGVPELLKKEGKQVAMGYLVQKEIDSLAIAVSPNAHPYLAIMGGIKVSDKIKVIDNLLKKADKILIGGAMAYTFLKATGVDVGASLVEESQLEYARNCLASGKIILPVDHVVGTGIDATEGKVTEGQRIPEGEMGLDIGPKTVALFASEIAKAKIIFLNGPLGVFENKVFASGTKGVFEALVSSKAFTIIGGGDSASAAKKLGYAKEKFGHVSTGGGASLEMIENDGHLPGIDILDL